MKKLVLVFLLSICSNSLFANVELDSLNFIKTKKVIQKEEEIAKAYKKYLLQKGSIPTEYNDLKKFLPKGFNKKDSFNRVLNVNNKAQIIGFPNNPNISLDSVYFSNSLRKHTKAPIKKGDNLKIDLKKGELIVFENPTLIKTKESDISTTGESWYLNNEILSFYNDGKIIFTFADDILISDNIQVLKNNYEQTKELRDLVQSKLGVYAGQKMFQKDGDKVAEYVNLQSSTIQINKPIELTKLLMKIVPSGAGLLLNGDIYMWGDNSNFALGVGINSEAGSSEQINTLVKVNSIYYDDLKDSDKTSNTINEQKQFSTIVRTKFSDLFFDYKKGLCGISVDDENLYCNGKEILDKFGEEFEEYDTSKNINQHLLHRHSFFNQIVTNDKGEPERKYLVKDFLILDNTYLVLTDKGLYYWGDNKYAWAGNGEKSDDKIIKPLKTGKVDNDTNFNQIAFIQDRSKRKLFGKRGENLYSWGNIRENENCKIEEDDLTLNICEIKSIKLEFQFVNIQSGMHYIFTQDVNKIYYKIDVDGNATKVLDDINSNDEADQVIKYFDYTKDAIVWIDSENKLKSKLLTGEDKSFGSAINSMNWLKIKVVNEHDAMCGLTTNSELYCWGDLRNEDLSSFVVPLFNANQFAENKDFMYGDLKTDYYNLKNPTYISGFNYDVEFNVNEIREEK